MTRPYYLREGENTCQCVAIGISDDCIHDETYECAECRLCCADEPMYKHNNQTYEEKATCIDCMIKKGMTIEELEGVTY